MGSEKAQVKASKVYTFNEFMETFLPDWDRALKAKPVGGDEEGVLLAQKALERLGQALSSQKKALA